jgi:hypothetical protein
MSPSAVSSPLKLKPALTLDSTASLSAADKIGAAMARSLPYLPADLQEAVKSFLQPETLAIIGATLIAWAGSQALGIGEIVDFVLLGVGWIYLGFSAFEGARELYNFAVDALDARSNADLDAAAQHFAHAVTILGVAAIQAVLLRGQSKATAEARSPVDPKTRNLGAPRQPPQVYPLAKVGAPPPAGSRPTVKYMKTLGGKSGDTTAYGDIRVALDQPVSEQGAALDHELVHRFFSPRTGPLRKLRATLKMTAYQRSALLQYLEETLAEGYAQLRMHGFKGTAWKEDVFKFPLRGGYLVLIGSRARTQGVVIGTIALGGSLFRVSILLSGPQTDD